MPAKTNFQSVHVSPLEGYLDTRSTPDELPFGSYRMISNFELTHTKKLCRMPGWQKFLSGDNYNNPDLHDQIGRSASNRQPITLGFEAVTPAGFSKLFFGTQNVIYSMNGPLDTYKVISNALGGTAQSGCAERRFKAGQVGSTIMFTNNYDAPVYHVIDQAGDATYHQSVQTVPDLNALGIRRAQAIIGWNGFMVLAVGNRVYWSDMNRPLSWTPAPDLSLAGYAEFDAGEEVLAFMPMMGYLFAYTTRGIWQGEVQQATTQGIIWARRYQAPKQNIRCLAYPNTLVSTGGNHYYWGLDGIYRYNLYDPQPELVDWLHRATALIFDDLNRERCQVHVGGYFEQKKTILWSWTKSGETCNTDTIAVNTEWPGCHFLGHGFSMFLACKPTAVKTVGEWLVEHCICTTAELAAADPDATMNGGRYCVTQSAAPACSTPPTCIYSNTPLVDGDITSEDYTGAPDADSLFAQLGDAKLDDLCASELAGCNADLLFLGASTTDKCLKEFSDGYFREMLSANVLCVTGDATKGYRGVYSRDGYQSRLLSGAMHFKDPNDIKMLSRFAIEAIAKLAVKPAQVILRVGMAGQALDPLVDYDKILWQEQDAKLLVPPLTTGLEHLAAGTMPEAEPLEWGLQWGGRFLFFEIVIVNTNVVPRDTGGAVCLSRLTADLRLVERLRQ